MKLIGFIYIFVSGFLIAFDLISQGYIDMNTLVSHKNDLYIDTSMLIAGLMYATNRRPHDNLF